MPRLARRRFISVLAGAVGAAGCSGVDHSANPQTFHRRSGWALGAPVSLTVAHEDSSVADRAFAAAFAELERVEQVMSLYRPESQLCRLNGDGYLTDPHPYLVDVLSAAVEMSRRTEGAFDVTVQPLWEMHAAAQRAGRGPTLAELREARRRIGWQQLQFDRRQVRLRGGGTVTLNGIAQGFASDRVAAVLREQGIAHALLDAGEFGTLGAKPTGSGWRVGIQHPRAPDRLLAITELAGQCLATSGDYATSFSNDFRRHHIFDPRTGDSPRELASVSVVAPQAMLADALSTAVFVLGPDAGLQLICDTPGAAGLLVSKSGEQRRTANFPGRVSAGRGAPEPELDIS